MTAFKKYRVDIVNQHSGEGVSLSSSVWPVSEGLGKLPKGAERMTGLRR